MKEKKGTIESNSTVPFCKNVGFEVSDQRSEVNQRKWGRRLPLEPMAQNGQRMIEQQTRTGIAHDTDDAPTHLRLVTMDGATATRGLGFAKLTATQTLVCVSQQFAAVGAKLSPFTPMLTMTIQGDHLSDHALFLFDFSHHLRRKKEDEWKRKEKLFYASP